MPAFHRKEYINQLDRLVSAFPVVAICGPRQCGKTTLVRSHLQDFDYLDLELPSDYEKIMSDPELFLSSRSRPLIIDEAQRAPEIFPILRSLIDRNRSAKGRFIILGSASFTLTQGINESLAGRVGFLDLSPLLLPEVSLTCDFKSHWLKGGFPEALLSEDNSSLNFLWHENYSRSLIERDLPTLGIDLDPLQFRKLWAMCAHFHSQLLNKNKIAASLGISPHTVDRYISILDQTFALRLLPPYHVNVKKRLIKTPKLYFRDSGVFHYFSKILNAEELITSPERGASFEGYIIEQLIQGARLRNDGSEPFFFRTSDNYEVDLLLVRGREITAFEVKCKLSPTKEDVTGLIKAKEILPLTRSIVIGLGADRYPIKDGIECYGISALRDSLVSKFWE